MNYQIIIDPYHYYLFCQKCVKGWRITSSPLIYHQETDDHLNRVGISSGNSASIPTCQIDCQSATRSILGPLLFNIYVDDLPSVQKQFTSVIC